VFTTVTFHECNRGIFQVCGLSQRSQNQTKKNRHFSPKKHDKMFFGQIDSFLLINNIACRCTFLWKRGGGFNVFNVMHIAQVPVSEKRKKTKKRGEIARKSSSLLSFQNKSCWRALQTAKWKR